MQPKPMLYYENNQQIRSVKVEAIKLEVRQGGHSNFIILKIIIRTSAVLIQATNVIAC